MKESEIKKRKERRKKRKNKKKKLKHIYTTQEKLFFLYFFASFFTEHFRNGKICSRSFLRQNKKKRKKKENNCTQFYDDVDMKIRHVLCVFYAGFFDAALSDETVDDGKSTYKVPVGEFQKKFRNHTPYSIFFICLIRKT